ncbi:MAG TPA: cobalamin-independent methionine synthase II family protein [Candidatus Binataceae bacterium]|nr:cobalamin-independent methionine synthase II family protein [Candidatus Binataceae bacterium]
MSTTLYRAQTIGSMLRPAALRDARHALRRGEISTAAFKQIEDRAVDDALAMQQRAGIDVVSDGEQRRASFLGSLLEATEGLTRDLSITKPWHENDEQVSELSLGLAVTGKLRRLRSLVSEEYAYARARSPLPVKVTLPSPMMLLMFWSAELARDAYRDIFEVFADGAEVIRAEIAELARLGCEYIQIDAPELAILIDPKAQEVVFERNGIDPARVLGEGVELLNSLADAPGVAFGLHLCRGNNDGRWLSKGGYESISKEVFRRANRFSAFLLEYDDPRSGGFEPLADIPRDKVVVLGLVSTKHPELESPDLLNRRIDEAARYFPREQMALSPQCGFASGIKGNPIDLAAQERKLRLVAEVAHRVWP